jgi:hypothetical protein
MSVTAVEYFHRFRDAERPALEKLGHPVSPRLTTSRHSTTPSTMMRDSQSDTRSTSRPRSKAA